MENQSTLKENLHGKSSTVNLIKLSIILVSTFSICLYFLFVFYNPTEFLKITPGFIFIIICFLWGPLLIVIGGSSYIARMSTLSRIPTSSSLYDAIVLPTIQYGPLKIILPVIDEANLVEEKED
ncbi:MAG: hypothetical protein ACFFB5_02320 [Promethearchaeota archaeon]